MFMKKLVSFLLICLFITGCGNENQSIKISFDNSYYQVATPYQTASGSYSIRDYDKEEVEKMLMMLSSEYFKINNSLYQEGQYLTTEEMKNLVTQYNTTDEIIVDDIKINPSYITAIYEQNYLATNNVLKGISLAIIVDNVQQYNQNQYKEIDENIVLDYALTKAWELNNYMRTKEGLQDINIVIGIYLEDDFKGSFKYVGSTTNNNLKLDYVNYNYQLLDSNYIMNNDSNTYNTILAIKNSLNNHNVYVNSYGLYKDKELLEVHIIINKSYFKRSEILDISSGIANNLNTFDGVSVKVYLKSNGITQGFIDKESSATKIETYILEE